MIEPQTFTHARQVFYHQATYVILEKPLYISKPVPGFWYSNTKWIM